MKRRGIRSLPAAEGAAPDPALLLLPTDIALSEFLGLSILLLRKITEVANSKCCAI